MKSREAISFAAPPRDIRPATRVATRDTEQLRQNAEQAAYHRGRVDGEKVLSEQLLQQRSELLALHQGVVEALRTAVPQVIRETESALVQLALEAAQKIVAGLPVSAQMVESVVREAVKQIEDSAEVTIQLHPDDLALLHKHKSPILQGLPETGSLRFGSSSEVTRGGCVIHTSFGLIDARRETKFEQLRDSLVT